MPKIKELLDYDGSYGNYDYFAVDKKIQDDSYVTQKMSVGKLLANSKTKKLLWGSSQFNLNVAKHLKDATATTGWVNTFPNKMDKEDVVDNKTNPTYNWSQGWDNVDIGYLKMFEDWTQYDEFEIWTANDDMTCPRVLTIKMDEVKEFADKWNTGMPYPDAARGDQRAEVVVAVQKQGISEADYQAKISSMREIIKANGGTITEEKPWGTDPVTYLFKYTVKGFAHTYDKHRVLNISSNGRNVWINFVYSYIQATKGNVKTYGWWVYSEDACLNSIWGVKLHLGA